MLPIQIMTPKTLDQAVRQYLDMILPPQSINEVIVDLGVVVMTDYIRTKIAPDVLRYESVGYDLVKLCSKLTETRR